jgi:hypothetical protein
LKSELRKLLSATRDRHLQQRLRPFLLALPRRN